MVCGSVSTQCENPLIVASGAVGVEIDGIQFAAVRPQATPISLTNCIASKVRNCTFAAVPATYTGTPTIEVLLTTCHSTVLEKNIFRCQTQPGQTYKTSQTGVLVAGGSALLRDNYLDIDCSQAGSGNYYGRGVVASNGAVVVVEGGSLKSAGIGTGVAQSGDLVLTQDTAANMIIVKNLRYNAAAVLNVAGTYTNVFTDLDIFDATSGANASGLATTAQLNTAIPHPIAQAQVGGTGSYYVEALDSSGAALPSKTDVLAIQNNTLCVRSVPTMIERPAAGTATYRIELLLYDDKGNMAAPDSPPTVDLVNQSGASLDTRLDSTTMTLVSTGRYRSIYTASATDPTGQAVWTFSVVQGGVTRAYTNTSVTVDTIAVDFTADDRIVLNSLATAADVSAIPTNPLLASDVRLPAVGSGKVVAAIADLPAAQDNAGITAAKAAAQNVDNLTKAGGGGDLAAIAGDVGALAAAVGTLTAGERAALADAILGRDVANAESAAAACSLATLLLAATNKANTICAPRQVDDLSHRWRNGTRTDTGDGGRDGAADRRHWLAIGTEVAIW